MNFLIWTTEKIKEKQVSKKIFNKIIFFNKKFFLIIVREKSKYIFDLLTDSFKLKEEKQKYSAWKSRIEGVGSNGSISNKSKDFGFDGINSYGSTSSDCYGGTISTYKSKGSKGEKEKEKKEEKKKESDDEDSSSSSDDDKKKKKKKGKKNP